MLLSVNFLFLTLTLPLNIPLCSQSGLTNNYHYHSYWADPLFITGLGAQLDPVSCQQSAKNCPSLLPEQKPLDKSICNFIAQDLKMTLSYGHKHIKTFSLWFLVSLITRPSPIFSILFLTTLQYVLPALIRPISFSCLHILYMFHLYNLAHNAYSTKMLHSLISYY